MKQQCAAGQENKMKKTVKTIVAVFLAITLIASGSITADAASYSGKYWVKVNEQCNVVTVYEKSGTKWKPIRAMLCSTGIRNSGKETPRGTFYMGGRRQWGVMFFGVYAQYCTTISGDYLFHSVQYNKQKNYKSQPTDEFNMLGKHASHGCVRLSVMDAKWIYDNCKAGTKVTIYRSSNPGPMGKPEGIKVSTDRKEYWDPTDPNPNNPYYLLKKPVITVSSKKQLTVELGSKYTLKKYVTAKDPNTYMDLTDLVTVNKVTKYSEETKTYVKCSFSTKTEGIYKVQYKVKDKYSGTAYKTIKITVADSNRPAVSGAADRTVVTGEADAVKDITAKQAGKDMTEAVRVYVKEPEGADYTELTYEQAKAYVFEKAGEYSIRYVLSDTLGKYDDATAKITVTAVSEQTDL